MTSVPARASVYDRIKEHLDAADLIRRLDINLVRTSGAEAYCTPLCHESSSGESLHINLHTGAWTCRGCQASGVYGDLIQLVEYAINGGMTPTKGADQRGSATHQGAIQWLCDQFAIPYKAGESYNDPALDVVHMVAAHAHEFLIEKRPDVVEWIADKWGFDLATISSHRIGFLPSPITPALAQEALLTGSRRAFQASGIGWYPDGAFKTRFEGRVIFPYLENGQAIYLIGRATPWTPKLDGGRTAPKYHKLSVHSPERPQISKRISNDHLYLERVLDGMDPSAKVVVAEGVADAVALSSLGIPVVSPVTIAFNAADIERFARKVRERNISRVEILFDNELSGNGGEGARRVGRKLAERGLSVSILTLPLGREQLAARDEVVNELGEESFAEFEVADPRRRKEIIEECVSEDKRGWIREQIAASKIDAAEWVAAEGAGAAGKFDAIRKAGVDIVEMDATAIADTIVDVEDPLDRLLSFSSVIEMAAHVDEPLLRQRYAKVIADAAGKGITKASVLQRIAQHRKDVVRPARGEAKAKNAEQEERDNPVDLTLPPPSTTYVVPQAPPVMPAKSEEPGAPAAPLPIVEPQKSEHERLADYRDNVQRAIDKKAPEEQVGASVANGVIQSMGYTPFVTRTEMYLVRGNERVAVGNSRRSNEFSALLYTLAGLISAKPLHRPYIDVVVYHLRRQAIKISEVSWSHVARNGDVFFPTGDSLGHIIKIRPGAVSETRMSECKVPAVVGADFQPFEYTDDDGGIDAVFDLFRWSSITESDRLILLYWTACLPILRKIGTVPIVRIEGGSSSGKSRTIDAISMLVNGGKHSSVPTAPALISSLADSMLTIDDNREACDVNQDFLGTLLQASQLGARSKRKKDSDTGTVVERVCGALLMNGIEPIHNGKSELASRMMVLRAHLSNRAPDSPRDDQRFMLATLNLRDAFWSDAVRRCAAALAMDLEHGERVGGMIEGMFGETRIGRLSAYLRVMYFAWVAGLPTAAQEEALETVDPKWVRAFTRVGEHAIESLVREELAVTSIRYAFDYGAMTATKELPASTLSEAFGGKFVADTYTNREALGPFSAPQLARLIRSAGKEMNAPRGVTNDLRAGQLEARLLDGIGFLEAAGIFTDVEQTKKGKIRFSFIRVIDQQRESEDGLPPEEKQSEAGDSWAPAGI